ELYGSEFWKDVVHFDRLARYETISESDLALFQYADDPETAFRILQEGLTKYYLRPEVPLPEVLKGEPDI
ncbi:MAG: lysine decarboxylase, partial [Acidobacteria bacterium]|nr:lysine decarboxylase [Acidobacteriota bacterium]